MTWEQSAKSFWSVILKNEWPYSLRQTYKKDSLSYNFTDRNYMHLGAVAKLVSNGVSTQGEEGWLIYGPYLQFSEGRYLVKVEFKHFEPSESFIDIYSDRDKEIFFKDYLKNLAKDDKKNTVVSFAFVLNKQIEDLEIRIFVDEEADLCISKIGIVEVDI